MITVCLGVVGPGVVGVVLTPVGGAAGLLGVVMQGEPAPCKSTSATSSEESELATSGVLQ